MAMHQNIRHSMDRGLAPCVRVKGGHFENLVIHLNIDSNLAGNETLEVKNDFVFSTGLN